jgi:4-hydroxy-2-oxoheptanedioate aldolase
MENIVYGIEAQFMSESSICAVKMAFAESCCPISAIHAIHHHSEGKTFVFVRVPKDDEVFLTACLDAGVDGIMLPHTESAEEVKELADKIYYPPLGKRSFSPWTFAPGVSGHSIYPNDLGNLQTSNNHIALIAQVESVKGIENLEEICSNPLIDSLLFGPGDFRADAGLSLLPSGPDLEPVFKSALEKVAKVTSERKIVLIGAAHDPAMLPQVLKGGARAIVIMFDYWFISQNVSKMVADGHKTLAELGNEKNVAN